MENVIKGPWKSKNIYITKAGDDNRRKIMSYLEALLAQETAFNNGLPCLIYIFNNDRAKCFLIPCSKEEYLMQVNKLNKEINVKKTT